jgi:hypothetical protein
VFFSGRERFQYTQDTPVRVLLADYSGAEVLHESFFEASIGIPEMMNFMILTEGQKWTDLPKNASQEGQKF